MKKIILIASLLLPTPAIAQNDTPTGIVPIWSMPKDSLIKYIEDYITKHFDSVYVTRYLSVTLPAISVGTTTQNITFATMPNIQYIIIPELQGTTSLLGSLSVNGITNKTTTSATIQLKNTGVATLSAGGTLNVTIIGRK